MALFISIIVLRETDNIPWNILNNLYIQYEYEISREIFTGILPIPYNNVMDPNNVMRATEPGPI